MLSKQTGCSKNILQNVKADNGGRELWNYLLSIAKFPVVVLHLTEAKGFIYRFIKNDKNEGTHEFHQGEKWDYGCLSFVQSSICGSPG